jgi:DNA-binding NarL/FixJ family response regulator
VPITVRVFLLDDHEVVRRGVRELLEAEDDLTVVGEASTAAEALARIPPTRPDVAVPDVRVPDGNGVEVCREVRSRHPEIQCLMLTSFVDDEALFSAIMAGAAGYVLKQIRGVELVASALGARRGRSTGLLVRAGEQDLIAEGRTNRQIAEEIFLAEKTVKNYVSSLLSKLGMQRRTEAAAYAARLAERRRHHTFPPD